MLLIHYSTVVYIDIRPRGPTFCVSIKNFSVCKGTASLFQCQVSIVVRINIEQTIFTLFVKFMYQHAFIDITMIIRGEIQV